MAVRLEVAKNCPEALSQFLLEQFNLSKDQLYQVDGPVNMVRLSELIDHANQANLRFPAFRQDRYQARAKIFLRRLTNTTSSYTIRFNLSKR